MILKLKDSCSYIFPFSLDTLFHILGCLWNHLRYHGIPLKPASLLLADMVVKFSDLMRDTWWLSSISNANNFFCITLICSLVNLKFPCQGNGVARSLLQCSYVSWLWSAYEKRCYDPLCIVVNLLRETSTFIQNK